MRLTKNVISCMQKLETRNEIESYAKKNDKNVLTSYGFIVKF